MRFQRNYKAIQQNVFQHGDYMLIPIRYIDRHKIRIWRNEQLEILRQKKPLTKIDQDAYFNNIISNLFFAEKPSQLIFSLLLNDKLIGYGGLVHINWHTMKAEISFLNDTKRAKELSTFTKDLIHFLILLEQIAFKELKLKCINTYAYNLRPYLYPILVTAGYKKADSVLNTRGQNDKKHEIVIHYKMNNSA